MNHVTHLFQHNESKQKIETIESKDLNLDISPRLEILEVNDPPERKAGIKVADVSNLVDKLKNEAKVI